MEDARHRLRKAAILIDTLDRRSADALLDQIGEAEADRVRQAVFDLGDVSRAEREYVLSEFLGRSPSPDPTDAMDMPPDSGVEIDQSLAARFAQDAPGPEPAIEEDAPFQFLHEATDELVAQFLQQENPQTIAVVLAHLPAHRAAELLARLGPDLQTETIRRIVHLEEMSPDVLRDVEQELGSRLRDQLQAVHREQVGISAVRRILDAAGAVERQEMLAQIAGADASLGNLLGAPARGTPKARAGESWTVDGPRHAAMPRIIAGPARHGPELPSPAVANTAPPTGRPAVSGDTADEVPSVLRTPAAPSTVKVEVPHSVTQSPAFRFGDLARLSDAALAAIFADADWDVAVLALTGADSQLMQRVVKTLPLPKAKHLALRAAQPGPLRLSDIEQAQAEIARLAQQLVPQGNGNCAKPSLGIAKTA